MKYLGLFVIVSSAVAFAAPQDFGGRQGGRGGFPPFASPVSTALDANQDGTISGTEIDNAPTVLKALDRNADGRIDVTELRPMGRGGREGRGPEGGEGRERGGREGGRPGMTAEPGETPTTSPDELAALLMAFDKNSDGNLEKNEVPERMAGIFDRADVNKDGKVNADEIKKSAAAASQPNAMGGREGFGREGGRGGREGMGRGGPGGLDPLVTALDLNHDGTLQSDELAAAPASLRTLDKNKDGQLTGDEYRQMGPGRQLEGIR